jgi:GT2 family glycosyltransferase
MAERPTPTLGVVVVAFRSQDVIIECLETLVGSLGVELKVVVVDNASPDATCAAIADWASGAAPFQRPADSPLPPRQPIAKPLALETLDEADVGRALGPLTLIRSSVNRGFAGGVNVGLQALKDQVDGYWILNPDCVVPPETAAAYAAAAQATPGFGLMTCRTMYYHWPDRTQTTGGRVDRLTGVCHQRNTDAEPTDAQGVEWVTGANMLVSPAFLERVGLMREDYFLYYEEVDWAFRRGDLPIVFVPEAVVYHHGGSTIGSGSLDTRPSAFSNYFNHRNRIRFARRFISRFPAGAYLFGLAKAGQLTLVGAFDEAYAVIAGMFEWRPPRGVREKLSDPRAAALAFGRSGDGG